MIVHRVRGSGREFLLLHRSHGGPAHEGDWAWTPPAGARLPGEAIDVCARRELREEVGLALPIRAVPGGSSDWRTYEAAVGADVDVAIQDAEHDRLEWVTLDEALRRCLPAPVAEAFQRVADLLDASGTARLNLVELYDRGLADFGALSAVEKDVFVLRDVDIFHEMEGGIEDYLLGGNHEAQLLWLMGALRRIGDLASTALLISLRKLGESDREEMSPLCRRFYDLRKRRWDLLLEHLHQQGVELDE